LNKLLVYEKQHRELTEHVLSETVLMIEFLACNLTSLVVDSDGFDTLEPKLSSYRWPRVVSRSEDQVRGKDA
jgi:hypothetical protein